MRNTTGSSSTRLKTERVYVTVFRKDNVPQIPALQDGITAASDAAKPMFSMSVAAASTMLSPSERQSMKSSSAGTSSPVVDYNIHPVSVESSKQQCRVLLVAADSCHETDFLEACRNIDDSDCVSTSFELVLFPLSHTNDLLLFLKTFGPYTVRIFLGAVLLIPPAATRSRLGHCDIPGQVPLRTRVSPAGRAGLSPALQKKVNDANRCIEITVWFDEQPLSRFARPVALFFHIPRRFWPSRRTSFTMGAPRVEATSGCH